MSDQFLITGKGPKLEVNLRHPLELKDEYEISLICFSVYNIIFNVEKEDVNFTFDGKEEKIHLGAYEVDEISEKIKDLGIEITLDTSTGKSLLIIPERKL